MEKEFDIDNLTHDDFMEMAAYVAMSEKKNVELINELREAKAYVAALVQQRNSSEAKYQTLLAQRSVQVIDTVATVVSNVELTNPEQWAVPEGRVITTPKSNKQ
jgi:hypothetical protein